MLRYDSMCHGQNMVYGLWLMVIHPIINGILTTGVYIYMFYYIPMNGLLTTPNMDIIHPVAMKHMSAWQPRNMSP